MYQFVAPEVDTDDILHSHAIRRVGKKHGPVVPAARRKTSKENQVAGYRDSMVGSIAQYKDVALSDPKNKEEAAPTADESNIVGNRPMSSQLQHDKKDKEKKDHSLERRQHIIHPPRRNFHRFG